MFFNQINRLKTSVKGRVGTSEKTPLIGVIISENFQNNQTLTDAMGQFLGALHSRRTIFLKLQHSNSAAIFCI